MRHSIMSITQAKLKLLEMTRSLEDEGRSFVLTKNGLAVGALIPYEDYEALVEMFDIMENPALMRRVRRAIDEERRGEVWKRSASGKWTKARLTPQRH